jgi:hypothetical protein
MQTIELKSLVKQGIVTAISVLRQNVNDYPFVTFLSEGSTAQNVYFGKGFAEEILGRYEVGDNVLNELISAVIVQTANADGEVRYKIGRSTNYVSTAALSAAFGLDLEGDKITDFNLGDFKQGFEAKAVERPAPIKAKTPKLQKAA